MRMVDATDLNRRRRVVSNGGDELEGIVVHVANTTFFLALDPNPHPDEPDEIHLDRDRYRIEKGK